MGSGLPEAIGACLARDGRLTTCLIGDGSLMFNLQELSTIKHLNLPIKIFVLNNGGYLAIRHTQDSFLEGRYHGTGKEDLALPKIQNIAACFGLNYAPLVPPYDEEIIGMVLDDGRPVLCEVFTPHDQRMVRAQMGKPLSEMVF
jgi:acetolactate synthase-1/2/3 large subunit